MTQKEYSMKYRMICAHDAKEFENKLNKLSGYEIASTQPVTRSSYTYNILMIKNIKELKEIK